MRHRRAGSVVTLFVLGCFLPSCELFSGLAPCTPGGSASCPIGESCDDDGFCRPAGDVDAAVTDDGGGVARDAGHDAGGSADDGGPLDAGPVVEEAGPGDGGSAGSDAGLDDAGEQGDDAGHDAGPQAECGDGLVEGDEECDDGVAGDGGTADGGPGNSDTLPDACRTDCSLPRCGDGVVDTGEKCDGALVDGLLCVEAGHLTGASPPLCRSDVCDALDITTCGDRIDSAARIQTAIGETYSLDRVVSVRIQGGEYEVGTTIAVNDTTWPYRGVVLEPVAGEQVTLRPSASGLSGPILLLDSGNSVVRNLHFDEAAEAIAVESQNNVVMQCLFTNSATAVSKSVDVPGQDNTVHHNRFANDAAGVAGYAIRVDNNDDVLIARNVIRGGYLEAISVWQNNPSNRRVWIDHNTIRVAGAGSTGVAVTDVGQLCYRNNVVVGDGSTTGLKLEGTVTPSTSSTTPCESIATQKNFLFGHGTQCSGAACNATTCDGTDARPMCHLLGDPLLRDDGCLDAGSTGIGAAVPVDNREPIDQDGKILSYVNVLPDVGAREATTSTAYARGPVVTCP